MSHTWLASQWRDGVGDRLTLPFGAMARTASKSYPNRQNPRAHERIDNERR